MHPFLNITKLIEKYWLLPTEVNFRANKTKNTNWKIKNNYYNRKKLKKVGILLSGPPIWVVSLAQKVDVNMTFWGVPWVGHNDTLPLPLERSLPLFLVSAPLKRTTWSLGDDLFFLLLARFWRCCLCIPFFLSFLCFSSGAVLYYYFYKRTALRLGDPRFYKDSQWLREEFSRTHWHFNSVKFLIIFYVQFYSASLLFHKPCCYFLVPWENIRWSSMGLYSDFSYEGTQMSAFSFIGSLHNLNNYGLLAFDGKFMDCVPCGSIALVKPRPHEDDCKRKR